MTYFPHELSIVCRCLSQTGQKPISRRAKTPAAQSVLRDSLDAVKIQIWIAMCLSPNRSRHQEAAWHPMLAQYFFTDS